MMRTLRMTCTGVSVAATLAMSSCAHPPPQQSPMPSRAPGWVAYSVSGSADAVRIEHRTPGPDNFVDTVSLSRRRLFAVVCRSYYGEGYYIDVESIEGGASVTVSVWEAIPDPEYYEKMIATRSDSGEHVHVVLNGLLESVPESETWGPGYVRWGNRATSAGGD